MTTKVERCAIYIRVSTTEQMMHGKSLEAQKEYLTNYAREHNMAVVGVYADEGKTARKELKKRKAIHSLLQDVEAGKIDVIIFWRIDRWFRNLSDFYKVQDILTATTSAGSVPVNQASTWKPEMGGCSLMWFCRLARTKSIPPVSVSNL